MATSATRPLVDALVAEHTLLARILRVSRLQHGRAPYYHRLNGAYKRLSAVLTCCAAGTLAMNGSAAPAHAAIERALDAIPAPWIKLRHLLAQTYFMPLALACMSLLSRAASLLAKLHVSLGLRTGTLASPPLLLALARPDHKTAEGILGNLFASSAGSAADTVTQPRPPQPHVVDAAPQEDDDLGEPLDDESAVDLDSLIYVDPRPAEVAPSMAHTAVDQPPMVEPETMLQPEERRRRRPHRRPSGHRRVRDLLALGTLAPRNRVAR